MLCLAARGQSEPSQRVEAGGGSRCVRAKDRGCRCDASIPCQPYQPYHYHVPSAKAANKGCERQAGVRVRQTGRARPWRQGNKMSMDTRRCLRPSLPSATQTRLIMGSNHAAAASPRLKFELAVPLHLSHMKPACGRAARLMNATPVCHARSRSFTLRFTDPAFCLQHEAPILSRRPRRRSPRPRRARRRSVALFSRLARYQSSPLGA